MAFAVGSGRSYLFSMASAAARNEGDNRNAGFAALWRFLPMLWPEGQLELKVRVIAAMLLVLAGKAATLLMPFAYKAVIDGMSVRRAAAYTLVAGLVAT